MGDRDATQGPVVQRSSWRVEHFDEVDSTNRRVMDRAREGAADGLVVVADHQTQGRGRLGRAWVAPPGSSLLASVLLRSEGGRPLRIEGLHLVTMAASLALAEAVETVAGVRSMLKWPNDLVVGDRKLAGVLCEVVLSAEAEVEAIVVGVGCNVDWSDVPAELVGRATACNLEGPISSGIP